MVDDHGNANKELIALAQTKNINIPEIWSNKSQDKYNDMPTPFILQILFVL